MATTNEIRTAFLEFYQANGHEIVSSSPLVPHNDPTLLFTNAGMVQFKNVFTGAEKREIPRATTSQKCVRAGGKHNDLDNVGYTARHHTFFEMLGNFSFGDYFKERAIDLAWTLVTKEFGLSAEKLLVTVYHTDDEAFDLWRRISGLPEEKILRIPTSDNFWAMGDTGPCGPCSEIFYDHGSHIPGGPPGSPDEDGDRFIEIWNLVFMQYEQIEPGNRIDLPRPSIDTGMGLERIAAVLQGKHDNYDTDLFQKLISASASESGCAPTGEHGTSHRVIADHLRAACFLMADGVMPSNEGRGYVLRRIMRRGMRHAYIMGTKEPLMWRLVPALVSEMGDAFPELKRAEPLVTETLRFEESRFRETLGRGLRLLEEATADLPSGEALSGEVAFKLYDTYGFPLDLTQDALRGMGREVDLPGFDTAMARQKAEARKSWAGSGDAATEEVWFDIREDVGATEFLGYVSDAADAQIVALVVDGKAVERVDSGAGVSIVCNQTPFYAESGGQIGDTGFISGDNDLTAQVTDVRKMAGDLHAHIAKVEHGSLSVGDNVRLQIDTGRRSELRRNHSVTHLLHAALRERLGEHVTQKGSSVAPDRLRFDISHPKAVTEDELADVERAVNAEILNNTSATTRLMSPDEAVEAGALALFGEKYGDEVRVVSMGSGEKTPYSVELCGGTHVGRTGDIGLFKILGESAVAAGVRRIEAVSGMGALDYVRQQTRLMREATALVRSGPTELPERITALINERKRLEKELSEARRAAATGASTNESAREEIAGIGFVGNVVKDVPLKDLRGMADSLKAKLGSGVVTLIGVNDGKAAIVVGVTDDLTDRVSAVELVRLGAAALGGKGGGGRADMAQAGGPNGDAGPDAIAAIKEGLSQVPEPA